MRILIAVSLTAFSLAAFGQGKAARSAHSRSGNPIVAPQCRREGLSVKEGETDAAMGGVRATDFFLTNTSPSPCTLNGYPGVALLNGKGRIVRRAAGSDQLPGDAEKMPPQLVTLDAGKTAWFRLYYNAGGAGYIGKPCPTYPRIRIVVPGMSRPFVLRSDIQLCPRTAFVVSSVRSGTP